MFIESLQWCMVWTTQLKHDKNIKKKIGPTLKFVDLFTPDKHFNLYSFSSKQNLAMQQRKNPYP